MLALYVVHCKLCVSACSGMETKIKSQKEAITELEEKIRAYHEEIKKVRCIMQHVLDSCAVHYS